MAMPPAEKVIVVDSHPSKNGHGDDLDHLPVADETSHQIGVGGVRADDRGEQRLRAGLLRLAHGAPGLGGWHRRPPPGGLRVHVRQRAAGPPPPPRRQASHQVQGPRGTHLRTQDVQGQLGDAVRQPLHDQHRLHHNSRTSAQGNVSAHQRRRRHEAALLHRRVRVRVRAVRVRDPVPVGAEDLAGLLHLLHPRLHRGSLRAVHQRRHPVAASGLQHPRRPVQQGVHHHRRGGEPGVRLQHRHAAGDPGHGACAGGEEHGEGAVVPVHRRLRAPLRHHLHRLLGLRQRHHHLPAQQRPWPRVDQGRRQPLRLPSDCHRTTHLRVAHVRVPGHPVREQSGRPVRDAQRDIQGRGTGKLPGREHAHGGGAAVPGRLHEPHGGAQHVPAHLRAGQPHVPRRQQKPPLLAAEVVALVQRRLLHRPRYHRRRRRAQAHRPRLQNIPHLRGCLTSFLPRLLKLLL